MHRRILTLRGVPLPAENEHLEPGRSILLAAALMGFVPFAALLLNARVGTLPSVWPHVPLAETSTSIDFRRGTGHVLRTMRCRGRAPAGIVPARGTMRIPPKWTAKRRSVAGASLHPFGAKPRSPTEARVHHGSSLRLLGRILAPKPFAGERFFRPPRLLLPWAFDLPRVLCPSRRSTATDSIPLERWHRPERGLTFDQRPRA